MKLLIARATIHVLHLQNKFETMNALSHIVYADILTLAKFTVQSPNIGYALYDATRV